MINFSNTQLLRLEAIRREAFVHHEALEDLEDEARDITGELDPYGHTVDLLYQSNMSVEELVRRLELEIEP